MPDAMPDSVEIDWRSFQSRVPMYLGEMSLQRIKNFLDGYALAAKIHSIAPDTDPFILATSQQFHDWVGHHFNVGRTAMSWDTHIEEHFQSETERVEAFFKMFEEFRKERASPDTAC